MKLRHHFFAVDVFILFHWLGVHNNTLMYDLLDCKEKQHVTFLSGHQANDINTSVQRSTCVSTSLNEAITCSYSLVTHFSILVYQGP